MEITLAKDEVLIKQYDYASTKSKHDVVMHSVIVTDKRIIAQEQGERSFARDEMPLDHADYIVTDFDSYKKPVKLAIVLFIISAIFAIGGLVWSLLTKDTYWFLIPTGLSVVVLVFAIIALISIFYALRLVIDFYLQNFVCEIANHFFRFDHIRSEAIVVLFDKIRQIPFGSVDVHDSARNIRSVLRVNG